MGVIEVKLRMASTRCMSGCTIVSLTKAEYEKRLNEAKHYLQGLLRFLSVKLRDVKNLKTLNSN